MFGKFDLKNFNFEKIRLWLVVLVVQAIGFAIGVYTGHTYFIPKTTTSSSLDYTTDASKNQSSASAVAPITDNATTGDSGASNNPENCTTIKGNISGSSKTYHIPGGSFYARTTPEMCFATEAEAKAAGFKKSSK